MVESKDRYVEQITSIFKSDGLTDDEIKKRLSKDITYSTMEKRINNINLLQSKAPKIDRILMNPPYSQGKKLQRLIS